MAFAQFEDLEGGCEILIFSDVFDRHQGLISPDTIILLDGTIDKRGGQAKIIASKMERVENLREKFQNQLQLNIKLRTSDITDDDLSDMATLMSIHKGETKVCMHIMSQHAKRPLKMNVRRFVVEPNNDLLKGLRNIIGKEHVQLSRSAS